MLSYINNAATAATNGLHNFWVLGACNKIFLANPYYMAGAMVLGGLFTAAHPNRSKVSYLQAHSSSTTQDRISFAEGALAVLIAATTLATAPSFYIALLLLGVPLAAAIAERTLLGSKDNKYLLHSAGILNSLYFAYRYGGELAVVAMATADVLAFILPIESLGHTGEERVRNLNEFINPLGSFSYAAAECLQKGLKNCGFVR